MAAAMERMFTVASLTKDGAIETRMSTGRVVFIPGSRPTQAAFAKHSGEAVLLWIARALASGETVVLHPDREAADSALTFEALS